MKKMIFLTCSLMAAALAYAQAPVITVNPTNLSEELYTGENAQQSLTVTNSGSTTLNCVATVAPVSATGMLNNALQFDGSNDYCIVYNDAVLQLSTQFTLEAWVNFQEGGSGTPALISKGRPVPHYEIFFDTTLANRKIGLALDPVGTLMSQSILAAGTWYHIAFTYDGSMMNLYINGELDASMAATGTLSTSTYGLYLGKRDNSAYHRYKGLMDDFRIWHVARSQDDIRQCMNHEFTVADTAMSGYWTFNEVSGTKAYDLTPYTNNATLLLGVARVESGAQIINWLDATPVTFSVPPGSSQLLTVLINSMQMNGGTYAGNVLFRSNDPVTPQFIVPVQLDVIPASNFILFQSQLNFGELFTGQTRSLNCLFSNDGNDTLRLTSITCQNPDFVIDLPAFKLAPNDSGQVTITYAPLSAGVDVADLVFASNDPDLPVATVQLMGTALSPPVISVSPGYFDISLYSGRTMENLMTVSNSGESELEFDLVNNAVDFNSNELIIAGNPSLYNLTNMTLEVWVNFDDYYNYGGIISLGNTESERFSLYHSDNQVCYRHNWTSNGSSTVTMACPGEGSWHHLAIAYNGTVIKYYIDGVLSKTSSIQAPINFSEDYSLIFGCLVGGSTDYLNAKLDEVRIWAYARTQAQVQQNMYSSLNGTEPGLVGYWRFEEREGDVAMDLSVNANNAIITNDLDRIEWSMTPGWLVFDPVEGVCDPGEDLNIALNVDACNLCGGDHTFDITIGSNDPSQPVVNVPVNLFITDAPCIKVSRDTLDFGILYIGFDNADTLTLDVSNRGSLDLMVTGVGASPGIFSATPGFAGIDPGETETFQVVFAPTSVGTYTGTLVLTSNDPLDEVYTIVLKGKYLVPPDISLTPGSIGAVAKSGKQVHSSFTVHNTGGSDLNFIISPGTNKALVLDGYDDYVYWYDFMPYYNVPMSQFTFECWIYFEEFYNSYEPIFNASVCYNNYDMDISLTSSNCIQFSFYDDNWNYRSVTSSSIDPKEWIHLACTYDGESQNIYLNGIENTSSQWSGTLSLTGYGMLGRQSSWYYSSYMEAYIDEVRLWNDARSSDEILEGMIHELSGSEEDLIGYWNFSEIEGGQALDKSPNHNDGNVNGSPVISEYTPPACSWLICNPLSGTCPVGSTVNIQVTFDASYLEGGMYESDIILFSNDPDDPQTSIHASFEVTDAPSILTGVDNLDFGEVFVGYPETMELYVTNNGSQDLLISGIVPAPGVFTASPPYMSIDPGESEVVTVTFSPLQAMHYTGTLTLLNNDPSHGQYIIHLYGDGLIAPEIAVSTNALDVSLQPGETEDKSLAVGNSGGSNLNYTITPSFNQSLSFDGTSNYVRIPVIAPIQNVSLSDFVFETWVYFNNFEGEDQYILNANTMASYYSMEIRTTSDQRIRFFVYDDYWNYREVYSSQLDPGTWYHLACIYSDNVQRILINGVEEASYNWAGHFTITSELMLGKQLNYNSGYLDGYLDETRIWMTGRTGAQVLQNMEREVDPGEEGLVGYWTFDNIGGISVYDQTDYYNDGILSSEDMVSGFKSPVHEWLSVSPASAAVPPGNNVASIVTFDAGSMADGNYYRTLRVTSNDPEHTVVEIPVHMLVGYGVGQGESGGRMQAVVSSYPNPFQRYTKIKYTLAEEVKVTVLIFDQMGQQLAVLADEVQQAGKHELTWNAEGLPAGIYYYKLAVGGQQSAATGKLVLLK